MDNYLIQADSVTISLDSYTELKNKEKALAKIKSGFIIETNYHDRYFIFYSLKEFDKEMKKRIEDKNKEVKGLRILLDDVCHLSIFEFVKFKRTYPYKKWE